MSESTSRAIPAASVAPPPNDLLPPDEGTAAELTAHAKRPPLFGFLAAYWRSADRWIALALFAAILAVIFGTTYLAVWANKLAGDVTDSLINRQWDALFTAMWTMLLVTGVSTLITVSNNALTSVLDLRWRTWLTNRLMARWTNAVTFYDIEREGLLKNAEQRIAEDARLFSTQSLDVVLSLIRFVVDAVTFTVLLWGLSKSISFNVGGQQWEIQGYMVYVAFLYGGLRLLVTHWFGRQIMPLTMRQQGVEADFRHLGMQLRENAEQIALYRGGERERLRLSERFSEVRSNTLSLIARRFKMDLANNTYGQVMQPLPTVV
ncbi:MAG: SbmA/BacA-like family transporter, partial [Casimicrobiaceae bacterium]